MDMTEMSGMTGGMVPVWPLLAALVALVGSVLLFPEQIRHALRALADFLREVLQSVSELLLSSRNALWQYVKPSLPVSPLYAILGTLLLAVAVAASIASYVVLQPTAEIILPFEDGSQATAFALVAFTGALSVLLHVCVRRLALAGVCLTELGLVICVSVLAWQRTMAVQQGIPVDLPDAVLVLDNSMPILATVLTALLQLAEFGVFAGGFGLAGAVLPVVLAAPALAALGICWAGVEILRRGGADRLLAGLGDDLANAAGVVRAAGGRLLNLPEAYRERRHHHEMQKLVHESQVATARSEAEERRAAEASARARAIAARDAASLHERALIGILTKTEREIAAQIAAAVHGRGEEFAEEIVGLARAHARREIAKGIRKSTPAVVGAVGQWAFALGPFTALRKATENGSSKTVN